MSYARRMTVIVDLFLVLHFALRMRSRPIARPVWGGGI